MKRMTARGIRRISDEKLAAMGKLLSIRGGGHSSIPAGVLHSAGVRSREFYDPDCPCSGCHARGLGIRDQHLPEPIDIVHEMARRLSVVALKRPVKARRRAKVLNEPIDRSW